MVDFKKLAVISNAAGDAIAEEQKHRNPLTEGEKGLAKLFFLKGVNWQKEQMMKHSESAEIGYWNQRGLSIRLDKSLEKLGFGEDMKVKVIIIKED